MDTPIEPQQQHQQQQYTVGSRIVLDGLRKARHLNGRHGTVASTIHVETGRRAIDLDLPSISGSRVQAKASNLVPEAPLRADIERAEYQDGTLVEEHGRAICHLLDVIRYIMARVYRCDRGISTIVDIEDLREMGARGLAMIQQLTGEAYSHWLGPGGYRGASGVGVYAHLLKYIKIDLPKFNAHDDNGNFLQEPFYQLMNGAVDESAAVGGWQTRVQGNFWVVGEDTEYEPGSGTYVIPDTNLKVVYKVLGIRNSLYALLLENFRHRYRPVKMTMTMLPWYGRLVYDGVALAATEDGQPGPPPMASDELERKLKQAVKHAEESGLVITRLLELEVEGSLDTIPDMSDFINTSRRESEENPAASLPQAFDPVEKKNQQSAATWTTQDDPSPFEQMLMNRLEAFPADSADDGTYWVMRRYDYTEEENPDHIGMVMAKLPGFGHTPIGQFQCTQSIQPVSTDILLSLVQTCTRTGLALPASLNIDDEECYERVKFLFDGRPKLETTTVIYYPPPSVEETRAAMLGGPGGPGF